METPVLLIVFRRPHTLRQVINALRSVAPSRIFVACDGPDVSRAGESELVAATKEVIDTEIDWPLVIEDNYYRTHHVMIKPGDVVLYEGGRLLHGRPIAFEGKAFANLFCHFKPVGYEAPKMPL